MAPSSNANKVETQIIFEAIFDRSSGDKLGIRTSKEAGALYIKDIGDGAVKVWNASHLNTSSEVRPGHRIIEVNGITGDASVLSDLCKEKVKLHVKIEAESHELEMEDICLKEEAPLISSKEETPTIIFEALFDRSSGQKLGIRTSKDSMSLRIEAIDDGAVKVWNASHLFTPNEVRVGDRIVEVNGISGDGQVLSKACKEDTKLQVKIQTVSHAGMEGISVGELVAPVAGKVMSWVGVLGESLTESLPETTKDQVKELAENTKEKLDSLTETTAEIAGQLGEATKEKLGSLGEATKEIAGELGEAAKEFATDLSEVAKDHVKELAGGFGEAVRTPGKVHSFKTRGGLIKAVEQGALGHGCRILSSRAQCSVSGTSYDLRRLRVGGGGDGFVELRDLLKLEREVHLMEHLRPHPHVVQCHATAVENWGKQHCRLLLCDPCVKSLQAHIKINGGCLSATETTEIGHQVAQGLQFLHGTGIVCGSVSTSAVLCGTDNLWKLGDMGVSTDVPVTAEEWREAHRSNRLHKDEPPEVQVAAEDKSVTVTTAADVWMLGVLLASCALGAHPFVSPWHPPMVCSDYTLVKEKELFKPPARALLDPLRARLCLLIQWMLENKPEHRLEIGEAAALLNTLAFTSAEELLQEMPEKVRVQFEDLIVSSANQLSKEHTPGWALARLQVALTTKVMRSGYGPAQQVQVAKQVDAVDDGTTSESTDDAPSLDGNSSDTESDGFNKEKASSQADSDDFFHHDLDFISNPHQPCSLIDEPLVQKKEDSGYEGNPFDAESPFSSLI